MLLLQAALERYGPIVVSMDLSDPILQFYRGGVYSAPGPLSAVVKQSVMQ